MCANIFGGAKAPKATAVAPTAQQVTKDEVKNVDKEEALRKRRSKGFDSTTLSNDRISQTILGSVGQATEAFKKTLGG